MITSTSIIIKTLNLDYVSSPTATVASSHSHWLNSQSEYSECCLYSDFLKAIEVNQTKHNLWQLPQLSWAGVIHQDTVIHLFGSLHLSTLYYTGSLSNLQLGQCVVSKEALKEAIWGKPSLLLAITITPLLTSLLLDTVRSQVWVSRRPSSLYPPPSEWAEWHETAFYCYLKFSTWVKCYYFLKQLFQMFATTPKHNALMTNIMST